MVAPERWWRSSAAEISGLVMDPVCPPVGARGRVASLRPVAELHFFTGTMDSGKSTLALQTNHNHAARGRIRSAERRVGKESVRTSIYLCSPYTYKQKQTKITE